MEPPKKTGGRTRLKSTLHWSMFLLLAGVVLGACASPRHSGQLRLDTEKAGLMRHAAAVRTAPGSISAARAVASRFLRDASRLLTLLKDREAVSELELRLLECAQRAERQVNETYFGGRAPTHAECGEEVIVDGCEAPISRAMALGREKHAVALACARKVLSELWPAPFSIEQRYRFYPNARVLETVSPEEEQRLIATGCTRELWRTIKPDLVLHDARVNLLQAVLILDFKFPCPDTNGPRWTEYTERSAYPNLSQKQVYKDALGGEALLISPRLITP